MTPQDVACTLGMMLEARDRRRQMQESHFSSHGSGTLVVATVVAPGEYKLSADTLAAADAMREALRQEFAAEIISSSDLDPATGPETWLVLSCTPDEAKLRAVAIEESHPLGRLFDIDVILPGPRPMPRAAVGAPRRTCLLCGRQAAECMRSGLHSREEVLRHIHHLVEGYLHGNDGGA